MTEITATEVLKRQEFYKEKLAKFRDENPMAFYQAVQSIIDEQWAADKKRYTAMHNVTSDGNANDL